MSETNPGSTAASAQPGPTAPPPRQTGPPEQTWASGGTLFAACLLLIDGILDILQGVSAIARDDVYAQVGSYVFRFDITTWGWIQLIVGIVAVLIAIGLFRDATWARICGVVIAALMVVSNFMWLPYAPYWAFISIGIGIFCIWSLATRRSAA
jgi:hypothetical protein